MDKQEYVWLSRDMCDKVGRCVAKKGDIWLYTKIRGYKQGEVWLSKETCG